MEEKSKLFVSPEKAQKILTYNNINEKTTYKNKTAKPYEGNTNNKNKTPDIHN